jgi:RNA polymerase sigma-70 factor (ECF subfamily)
MSATSGGPRPARSMLPSVSAFDLQDFQALFEERRDSVYRFLLRLTRNASDAEDLMQETFLAVWRKRGQIERRESAAAVLRRTAFRLYLNARERIERRASLAPTIPMDEIPTEHEHELERREAIGFLVQRVDEALDVLPAPAREAFVLFRYEGMSTTEIAELVGAPVKTVETRVLRATRLLCQHLSPFRHHAASL